MLADAPAQTTVALPITAGATSVVGGATANFPSPQNFANGATRLTILDSGNPAYQAATPFATPFEYASYTTNTVGTNTLSGMTRGEAGTTAKAFFANATIAVGWLAEDIYASVPFKFDEQSPTGASVVIPASGSIPASYLGINWRRIRITVSGRTTSGNTTDFLFMRLNGDSGTNYNYQVIDGNGTSLSGTGSGIAQAQFRVGYCGGGAAGAGIFGQTDIEIFDYSNTTKRKTFTSKSFVDVIMELAGGDWLTSTAAITSITLLPSAGNFASGTLVTTELVP